MLDVGVAPTLLERAAAKGTGSPMVWHAQQRRARSGSRTPVTGTTENRRRWRERPTWPPRDAVGRKATVDAGCPWLGWAAERRAAFPASPLQRACHRRSDQGGAGEGSALMDVRLKRIYEPAAASDGYRVLIDRLWPRGVSREQAKIDHWERELSPSTELREWFGHDPTRFGEFRRRYIDELRNHRSRISELRRRARQGTLTLVYSARDSKHNNAVVLAEVLRRGLPKSAKQL